MSFNYKELNKKQQAMFNNNINLGKTIDDIINDDTSHIAEPMDKETIRQIISRNIDDFMNDAPDYPSHNNKYEELNFN